jgi:hypothetical protein
VVVPRDRVAALRPYTTARYLSCKGKSGFSDEKNVDFFYPFILSRIQTNILWATCQIQYLPVVRYPASCSCRSCCQHENARGLMDASSVEQCRRIIVCVLNTLFPARFWAWAVPLNRRICRHGLHYVLDLVEVLDPKNRKLYWTGSVMSGFFAVMQNCHASMHAASWTPLRTSDNCSASSRRLRRRFRNIAAVHAHSQTA